MFEPVGLRFQAFKTYHRYFISKRTLTVKIDILRTICIFITLIAILQNIRPLAALILAAWLFLYFLKSES